MREDWVDWRSSLRVRWIVGIGLVLALVLVGWRETISQRLVPDARLNRQIELAQAALERGNLSSPDGQGARELFESVLATDPDQMVAREGLVAVRDTAVARTQQALQQRRLAQARKHLALAEGLSAPSVQLQPLRARLRDMEQASVDIDGLLARAASPDIADEQELALLNQVLQLDADNLAAAEGRHELLSRWLLDAGNLLAEGNLQAAQKIVERVVADDPAHVDLPPVKALIGEALSRQQRTRAQSLAAAVRDERAGRVDRAAKRYLALATDGGDATAAQEGLSRLAAQAAGQAQRQAADFRFVRAESSLAKARRWDPLSPAVAAAAQALQQSRRAQAQLVRKPAGSTPEQLSTLLREAEEAMARGEFVTPPGSSAWDKLRIAAAMAPEAASVKRLQSAFGERSKDCFEKAMTENQLGRAQACLEASLAQAPGHGGAAEARRRLADRWLGYAEERIGASDYLQAEKALASARRWQPTHPMLDPTVTRLRRARGSTPP